MNFVYVYVAFSIYSMLAYLFHEHLLSGCICLFSFGFPTINPSILMQKSEFPPKIRCKTNLSLEKGKNPYKLLSSKTFKMKFKCPSK